MKFRPPLHLNVVAIERGAFESLSTKVDNFTVLFRNIYNANLCLWKTPVTMAKKPYQSAGAVEYTDYISVEV